MLTAVAGCRDQERARPHEGQKTGRTRPVWTVCRTHSVLAGVLFGDALGARPSWPPGLTRRPGWPRSQGVGAAASFLNESHDHALTHEAAAPDCSGTAARSWMRLSPPSWMTA